MNADIWNNNEDWTPPDDIKDTLGHVTTVVGYVTASSIEDPGDPVGIGGPSDWLIVHDNAPGTVRNLAVPLNSTRFSFWVGNTNVAFVGVTPVPVASTGALLGLGIALAVIALVRLRR